MTEETRDGENHAYPHLHVEPEFFRMAGGLTKRELFAAMAMQGLAADPEPRGGMEAASIAVEWADALIAELSK